MGHKLVTVIIPTYNRGDLIVNAIKSVVAQSYPAVQIIVVDDGSIDDTAKKVARFENVEYYYQENKGQGACRNLGLVHARGDYIASLDSDDVWDENFLQTAIDALERYSADLVFLNWRQISDTEKVDSDWKLNNRWRKYESDPTGEWLLLKPEESRELVLDACPAPSSALLIRRRSMPSKWNEEMKIGDDWYLLMEMAVTQQCRLAFTLSTYWTKRIHTSNVYHGRDELEIIRDLGFHDESIMARDFGGLLTFREKAKFKRRMAIHQLNFGRLSWRREGMSSESVKYIAKALRIVPFGSLMYILKMGVNSIVNHLRIARSLDGKSSKIQLGQELPLD